MTYCLGLLVGEGLLMASDSRSNAGVDHVATVTKMAVFENSTGHFSVLLSAGNLATTQAVVTNLKQSLGSGDASRDLFASLTMFNAARVVGETLRSVLALDAAHVRPYGDPSASFLLGGQIGTEAPRLFQIYSAGNFIEASQSTSFLQIGEAKYGKPILDRMLGWETSLEAAGQLALLSFDATIRSNLSVAPPIDLLLYPAGSFSAAGRRRFMADDTYMETLTEAYSMGLRNVVSALPALPPNTF